jgi:hypothetical protein
MRELFSSYLGDALIILALVKLLRLNTIANILAILILTALVSFIIIAMGLGIITSPFIFLGFNNSEMNSIFPYLVVLTLVIIFFIWKNEIIKWIFMAKDELSKLKIDKFSDSISQSKYSDLIEKVYKDITEDINSFFYLIGFFLFVLYFQIDLVFFNHLPLLELDSNKFIAQLKPFDLWWLLPISIFLTVLYAKYYDWITSFKYEKFSILCRIIEGNNKSIVLADHCELKIISKDQIVVTTENSIKWNFCKSSDGSIYYLIDTSVDFNEFKQAYQLIDRNVTVSRSLNEVL